MCIGQTGWYCGKISKGEEGGGGEGWYVIILYYSNYSNYSYVFAIIFG